MVIINQSQWQFGLKFVPGPWRLMFVPDPIIGNSEQDPLIFLQGLGGGDERHLCGVVVLFCPPGLLLTCKKYILYKNFLCWKLFGKASC